MYGIIRDLYAYNAYNPVADKEAGVVAIIVKAGQGQAPYAWKEVVQRYAEVGITRYGLYWLVDARYSPESQKAAIKANHPDGNFGPLGLWLDIEKPVLSMSDAEYRTLPYAYYKTVESVWRGVQAYATFYPGWYTGKGAWALICSAMPIALQDEIASKTRLWTAQYNDFIDTPDLYGGWARLNTWHLWQRREGPDYNYFNGTQEEFERIYGVGLPPTNGGNTMPVIGKGKVVSSIGVKVRSLPEVSAFGIVVGSMPNGTLFNVSEQKAVAGGFWLQIADGALAGNWCAEVYNGARLCEYTPTVTPPPSGTVTILSADVHYLENGVEKVKHLT